MFGIGMPELILILAVALIVIGPKKLPEMARSLGKALNEFKSATQDFKNSLDSEISDLNKFKENEIDQIEARYRKQTDSAQEKTASEQPRPSGPEQAAGKNADQEQDLKPDTDEHGKSNE